jgi:hypothetical protein
MRIGHSILSFVAIGAFLAAGEGAAVTPPHSWHPIEASSVQLGAYCGGYPKEVRGLAINFDAECKASFGPTASATTVRQDAYGWVCRVAGQSDRGLDLQSVCQQRYGSEAIATLVGIGINDWRCLRPSDVSGHLVPVLLFPMEKLRAAEVPFVQAELQKIETLVGGIRLFYKERTSAAVPGTSAFVLVASTSAVDWQNLALSTDHPSGGFPLDRYGYQNRIKQELDNGRWNVLLEHSSVRVGGFVSLGSSPPQEPTWLGAASESDAHFFSAPPESSYVSCNPRQINSPQYENAFYASGHEFGHTLGLPHTDEYHFDIHMPKPEDYKSSIMYNGNGTQSKLFPFEACQALKFLATWQ